MSDFLQFAINKGREERVSNDDVVRWAGALDDWDCYNAAALEIALGYHRGELSYNFCDGAMNDLWSAVRAGCGTGTNQVSEPFFEIFEAFDAGEFHRKHDNSDDPVGDFTDPLVANAAE
ncbi:hypothetical protein JJB09_21335 [Rhizobium sp. KVB221]|uniref:Uncharacterized protein n=1 Tax=Rhizobium setariae TaxID=2801340 RepID=A0A936YPY0_9HYPH|nr:hypothetical protein [Rhizobium setariae]MBL0374560.1 hypothetical protein [Rhizobium setariae]